MSTHVQLPAVFIIVMSVCTAAAQVTDAIKQYVEEKISKAVHNYTQNIKKIDVTISARGGDTGTHGAK
jgi:ribosome-associated translation inhibitor RaiA